MADLTPIIETFEHRWMRAWMGGDSRALKSLTSSGFVMLVGSAPPMILDAPSWLEAAAAGRWRCRSYRFGDIYVRALGNTALFAARMEIEATIDGRDWSGPLWVSDLWRKGRIRRGWRMAQRIVSRTDEDSGLPAAVRSLQLWR